MRLSPKLWMCISRNNFSFETLDECYIKTKQLCECENGSMYSNRRSLFLQFFNDFFVSNCVAKKLPPDVNKKSVFACNRLDLHEIDVYGFDYDYTLACYKPVMGDVLYNLGRDVLVNKFKVHYPRIYFFSNSTSYIYVFQYLCSILQA
jgi:hypothetical protein